MHRQIACKAVRRALGSVFYGSIICKVLKLMFWKQKETFCDG